MRFLLCWIVLFASAVCYAQTDSTVKELDEVVFTAQRTKQRNGFVPYSVKIVNKQYLNDINPRTTAEALTGINGVVVQKTNHGGGSPFIRGLTGNQTLSLVDGIRLNNSTFRYGPNQYLNTTDAYAISRIEVVKGTGSVQYGSDALGGVIHVITADPRFVNDNVEVHGRVVGKYMSHDMEKTAHGDVSYSSKKVAFIGGISYRNFGDLFGGDTTGRQRPSGYSEWSFDSKLKFALKEHLHLTLAHQFLEQSHVPLYHRVKLENFLINEFDPQKRGLSYARLNWQGGGMLANEVEAVVSLQQTKEGRISKRQGSTTLRTETDRVSTIGFTTSVLSRFSKSWTANSGIELYHDQVNSDRMDANSQTGAVLHQRGLYPDNSRYGNFSVFSLHHVKLNNWYVDGGIRWNTFDIRIKDTTLGDVRLTPNAFVGNIGLMYSLTQFHNLYLNFSNGYRAPNVDDMGTLGIVDFRYEIPTANLKPEKSKHTEVGYKFTSSRLTGTFAAFYMKLNDLITRVKLDGQMINGYSVYRKENVQEAVIKGVESELQFQATDQLRMLGSIAYSHGENITAKEPLRRIPPVNGRLFLTWQNSKWFAGAEWMFAGKQDRLAQGDKDDNRIPKEGTPGWNILNVYSSYRLALFTINLGIQNIFNNDYRTHGSGVNGYGRSAWIQLTLNL